MAPTGTHFFGIMFMTGDGTTAENINKSNDDENDGTTTPTTTKTTSAVPSLTNKFHNNYPNNIDSTKNSAINPFSTTIASECANRLISGSDTKKTSRHLNHAWYNLANITRRGETKSTTTPNTFTMKALFLAFYVCLSLGLVETVANAELIPSKVLSGHKPHQQHPQKDDDNNNLLLLQSPLSMYQLQKQIMMMRAATVGKTEQKQRQHHNPHHHQHHHHHGQQHQIGQMSMNEDGSDNLLNGREKLVGQRPAIPQIVFVKLLDEEEKPAIVESDKSSNWNINDNNFLPLETYGFGRSLSSSSASSSSSSSLTAEEEDNLASSVVAERSVQQVPLLPKRKKSVRRCGTLLLKHIQTVCGGCLRSPNPSEADEALIMGKRDGESQLEFRNRIKKQAPGFSKITDICCTQRACDDDEVKPFCC